MIWTSNEIAGEDKPTRLYISHSRDNGKSWKKGGDMLWPNPRGAQEPAIVELNDGRFYALLRTNEGYQYESYSSYQGLTWTKPVRSKFKSPCASAILYKLWRTSTL